MIKMDDEINGLAMETMLAIVVRNDIIEDALKFLDELMEIYENKSPYFKYKKIKNKPKCCQYILFCLHSAGIIKRHSRNGVWKIDNYDALKRICMRLQKCYEDKEEMERIKRKHSGGVLYNDIQSVMYKVGREIAIKEKCSTIEAITSILIAYYIENYGKDDFIKDILRKMKIIEGIAKMEYANLEDGHP